MPLCDVALSWKMILGGHGKFLGIKCGHHNKNCNDEIAACC